MFYIKDDDGNQGYWLYPMAVAYPFFKTFRRMAGRICASKYNGLQRGLKSVIIEKRFVLCKGVIMKSKYFIVLFTVGFVITGIFSGTKCFAQSSSGCVVTEKRGTAEIVVSCPDGSRVVNAGGRTDLYRVGDRIDIYGLPVNQPSSLPGQTTTPGR